MKMKKRPPARVSRRARNIELAEAIQLSVTDEVGTKKRKFAPEAPSRTDGSGEFYRGVPITKWEELERKITQQRALKILQSHPGYCKCAGCQSFAPKAVQPIFFTEKYDAEAA